MTLSELQTFAEGLSRKFQYAGDPFRALAVVTEELGEVSSEINKMYLSESKVYQGKSGSYEKLSEELGDLLLATCYLANQCDVDLEQEIASKRVRIEKRFGSMLNTEIGE